LLVKQQTAAANCGIEIFTGYYIMYKRKLFVKK